MVQTLCRWNIRTSFSSIWNGIGMNFELCEDCQLLECDSMYLVEFIGVSEERSASIFRVKEKMFTILHSLTFQKNVIFMATAVRISKLITLFCIGFKLIAFVFLWGNKTVLVMQEENDNMFISSLSRTQHHLFLLPWESKHLLWSPGCITTGSGPASSAPPLTVSVGYKIFLHLVETGSNPFYVIILTSMSESKRHATAYSWKTIQKKKTLICMRYWIKL